MQMCCVLQARLNDARSAAEEAADATRHHSNKAQVGPTTSPAAVSAMLQQEHSVLTVSSDCSSDDASSVSASDTFMGSTAEQGLEAEKSLLSAAEQRAAASAEEYYKERCRVAAELEALKSIQASKCVP